MKMLPKGGNAPLAETGVVHVDLRWSTGHGDPRVAQFAVGEDGRVPDDGGFLIDGRREILGGAIRLAKSAAGHRGFIIQLDRIPAHIQRCVFAAALESGRFGDLEGAVITAEAGTGVQVGFELTGAADEQALIFAEIYRHKDAWKFRAFGQGFLGGLEALAEYFGVSDIGTPVVEDPPPPEPETADNAQPPPADPPRRSRGFPFKGLTLLILLLGGGAALWYFHPTLLKDPGTLLQSASALFSRAQTPETPEPKTSAHAQPTCPWTDDQVFERYHALGESYVKILRNVDRSNQFLSQLREELTKSDTECPASFRDDNRHEIEGLEKLPVAEWKDEATKLNICAGLLIKKTEAAMSHESRPIIIQRLVHEADRFRNLESDLTNISRDLAYLRNKTERLIKGFKDNLDACP